MQKQATILIGQIMQYRDKLYAKRHSVPADLEEKWNDLIKQADTLQPKINRRTRQKTISFKGSMTELKSLVSALSRLNGTIAH